MSGDGLLQEPPHPSQHELMVKMWLFPGLSIITAAAIAAVLVQMAFTPNTQISLALSCASWAVVVVIYAAVRRGGGSVDVLEPATEESSPEVDAEKDRFSATVS